MPVPETAVNENCRLVFGKQQIWTTMQLFDMQPKPEAPFMHGLSQHQLRHSILALDPGHHAGAGGFVDNISH